MSYVAIVIAPNNCEPECVYGPFLYERGDEVREKLATEFTGGYTIVVLCLENVDRIGSKYYK